jgi:predicted MFS family arabinose efflux permease
VSLFLLTYGLGQVLGNWIAGSMVDHVSSTRPIYVFLVAVLIVELYSL